MLLGREFLEVFESWATSYDQAVTGEDPQYREVFKDYDTILDEVAIKSVGTVLEFGVGTGNLSRKLIDLKHEVIGIEPSDPMRKLAKEKYPTLTVLEGDFLSYPPLSKEINTITSTYAFHHLNEQEKQIAIANFYKVLPAGGKVVFADTAYENEQTKKEIHASAKKNGHLDLLKDLQTEYYPFLEDLKRYFEEAGFSFESKQRNQFVWIMEAIKPKE